MCQLKYHQNQTDIHFICVEPMFKLVVVEASAAVAAVMARQSRETQYHKEEEQK